jgi:hypothetical protein
MSDTAPSRSVSSDLIDRAFGSPEDAFAAAGVSEGAA